jgi:glutamate racemase
LIQEEAGPNVTLIDSGQEAAKTVQAMLGEDAELAGSKAVGRFKCYVSDIPDKFDEVGTRFLGKPLVNAERVDFDAFLMDQGEKIYKSLNL